MENFTSKELLVIEFALNNRIEHFEQIQQHGYLNKYDSAQLESMHTALEKIKTLQSK